MEEVCRLQIGWADGTIVGLEEQRWPTAALVEVQERPPERILSIIDHTGIPEDASRSVIVNPSRGGGACVDDGPILTV